MTNGEVAKYSGVTHSVVTRLQNTGKLDYIDVGKRKVFRHAGVDEWVC